MLGQRLQRWPNIKSVFGPRLVVDGILVVIYDIRQDRSDVTVKRIIYKLLLDACHILVL